MARMGDWRDNKDVEIPLDGIGGVNIVVKADVHRSGMHMDMEVSAGVVLTASQVSTSLAMLSRTKPRRKVSQRWQRQPDMASTVYRITLSGTSIPRRSPATHEQDERKQS